MSDADHLLMHCVTRRYDPNILGIPGYIYDDGRVELLNSNEHLVLPAPAYELLQDIYARRSAAEARR